MASGYRWQEDEKGIFTLYQDEQPVLSASAQAEEFETGERIDTRQAALIDVKKQKQTLTLTYANEAGLRLTEYLTVTEAGAIVQCSISRNDGASVKSNRLIPLIAHGKGDEPYLWRDLGAKMLLAPYDNDMWMRYETAALRAGRKSYDVTVLLKEDTREGLLIGAMNFDIWKNAIACPGMDARILEARCGQGASDEGSHDYAPHGVIEGAEVFSSRFLVNFGADWRNLLELYADALAKERAPRMWDQGVPFGFNSYAGLAHTLNAENFRASGDFVREELTPRGFHNHGGTYINLDGGWQRISEEERLRIKDNLHAHGQKTGIYDAPFACFYPLDREIPLLPGHTFAEIVLRNEKGEPLPRIDRAVPYDVTHPLWLEWTEKKARQFIDWGYDYLKIDFLSHGGMEGIHHDPAVRTGRQALDFGYRTLEQLYDEKKIGRPFFISLSIAPLFPYGFGNARRFSCDAFGLSEDIEYVLNAQTYSWWTGGRLYQFNDPDHIVLQRSFCMLKDSTEGEARARYTSAVIAGSVMLLSEDYGRPGAKERTLKIVGNPAVNAIARSGVVFRPVDAAGGSACNTYTATIDGQIYVALFCWKPVGETVTVDLKRANLPCGTYEDVWSGKQVQSDAQFLVWSFDGTDAALLKKI
ncbi:MAG: hypothetical protein IJ189_00795 [Clostridia bacterium]|nr:hypothetical protein [Clostridia bacterium]